MTFCSLLFVIFVSFVVNCFFTPLQQAVARHAAALDDAAQLVERFDLDLANAFARQIEIGGDFFKRADLDAAQTVTALEHAPLLFRQLA